MYTGCQNYVIDSKEYLFTSAIYPKYVCIYAYFICPHEYAYFILWKYVRNKYDYISPAELQASLT